jgi:TnpA family transposase
MKSPAFSRAELVRQASLTAEDLARARQCRRDFNQLGFGYQTGFVRLLNRFPVQVPFEIYDELLKFTAAQLRIDADRIDEYAARQATVSQHQARLRAYLGLENYGDEEADRLAAFIFNEACRLEQTAALHARAREFLKDQGILLPADYALNRLVGEQRKLAREHIFEKLSMTLTGEVSKRVDELLAVETGSKISELQQIKANPSKPSPEAMVTLLRKLKIIEATGVIGLDLSWLNSNYQRALFHYVRKCSVHRLRELSESRRNASLVCFLWQSYRDAIDQAVDMFGKLLTRIESQAGHELDAQMRDQRKAIKSSLSTLKTVGEVVLDESVDDGAVRERIFSELSREELATQLSSISQWISGRKSDVFYGVLRRFSYLRRFSPVFLETLVLAEEPNGDQSPCLEATEVLRRLNAENKRKLPDDVPTAFLSKRLKPLVEDGDKRAWECALLLKLRDEIKAGNISVERSKRFGNFDDFFITASDWESLREGFFRRAKLPSNPSEIPEFLRARLDKAYDLFLREAPGNSYAQADETGWHLSADPSEKLDEEAQSKLDHLKSWLSKHMRSIKLPELLIEVDNDLGFTSHFMAQAQGERRDPDDICTILATVLAHGCNVGLHTMSRLTEDISYKQLKRVSDWLLTGETQRTALAEIVHAISRLDATAAWGEGRTSASDGQRFSLRRRILQQTYSTRFSDFALEFYSFVADNYAPFYSTPIECTDRDSAFVLDGLLYNESDLDLEEHYTDTHGYTEVNFAAFAMLGRRFCPRIRGVKHQRIYRIDRERDYGALCGLVGRADRTLDPGIIAEQWDRMGQLYASLERGHATASVALKRLVSYSAKNRFYRANRDLGRVLKTEFILSYMSQPQLRARIRRGLLKVEQLHALARDVYYGRRGRVNARELHEQMNSCSCLTLILACIIYWQAREISKAVRENDPAKEGVDVGMLKHISPIEWENVVLYGQYVIDRRLIRRAKNR